MRYIYYVENKPVFLVDVMLYQTKETRLRQAEKKALEKLEEVMMKEWKKRGYSGEEIDELRDRFL